MISMEGKVSNAVAISPVSHDDTLGIYMWVREACDFCNRSSSAQLQLQIQPRIPSPFISLRESLRIPTVVNLIAS